jgi:hypothetical protein
VAEKLSIEGKLVGRRVVDPHGYKIGTINALFVHCDREVPKWARVKMGILGTDSALIRLHDAQEDGDDVRVVYEKEHVNAAPEVEPDGDELSDEDADKLHGHYGLERVLGLQGRRGARHRGGRGAGDPECRALAGRELIVRIRRAEPGQVGLPPVVGRRFRVASR